MIPPPRGLYPWPIPRRYLLLEADDPQGLQYPFDVVTWARREAWDEIHWLYLLGIPGLGKSSGLRQIDNLLTEHGVHTFLSSLNAPPARPETFLENVILQWADKLASTFPQMRGIVAAQKTWRSRLDKLREHFPCASVCNFCLLIDGLHLCPDEVQKFVRTDFLSKYLAQIADETPLRFTAIVALRGLPAYRGAYPAAQGDITLAPLAGDELRGFVARQCAALVAANEAAGNITNRAARQAYARAIEGIFFRSPLPSWVALNRLRDLGGDEAPAIGESILPALTGVPGIDLLLLARALSCRTHALTLADREACAQAYVEPIWPEVGARWADFLTLVRAPTPRSKHAFTRAGISSDDHPLLRAAILRPFLSEYEFDRAFQSLLVP